MRGTGTVIDDIRPHGGKPPLNRPFVEELDLLPFDARVKRVDP